jgi:uncharacterized protein DUF1592/uncharacterized protein DUF1588
MRYARRLSISSVRWLPAVLPLCAALAVGCHGKVGDVGPSGTGGSIGGGGAAGADVPCSGAADPRLVVAGQRVMLLTKGQIISTVRYLINDAEADALLSSGMFSITPFTEMHFPPADGESENINPTSVLPLVNLAEHVGNYVAANFGTVTGCTTGDLCACATTWLNNRAKMAYRRPLTAPEQTRFTNLFATLRSQLVNGCSVTNSCQQATGWAVMALLLSPQLTWRWEIGGSQMSTSPPGIYLTDHELASQVSFFLTDQPPDDTLVAAATAGTLRANIGTHVSRILQTQGSRLWLRTVMELYFLINQLPTVPRDLGKFPNFDEGMVNSMLADADRFLDKVLWTGTLNDLLLSKTAFVNNRLARDIYGITPPAGTAPAGAPDDQFVEVTLPATQRSGILTNAAFLAARGRSDGLGLVVPRGKTVKAAFLCLPTAPPDLSKIGPQVEAAVMKFSTQTGQEQVADRAKVPLCKECHSTFDSYGLALEFYNNIGVYRTNYDYLTGMPAIDGSTALPTELGGATVTNAIELAQNLANSPTFTNCMAASLLQYAMTELSASVQVALPPKQSGCAAADVAQRYESGTSKTFTGMMTAVTQSPAFAIRKAAP